MLSLYNQTYKNGIINLLRILKDYAVSLKTFIVKNLRNLLEHNDFKIIQQRNI